MKLRDPRFAMLVGLSVACLTFTASAACLSDFYEVDIGNTEVTAKTVSISKAVAKHGGSYKDLADAETEDRKAVVEDKTLSPTLKAKALSFLDSNVRVARCWAAGQR